MFDKIIKVALVCLLASLLGVVGWFCWTRRDAGRFTFHQKENGSTWVVSDGNTGALYVQLFQSKPEKPSWLEMQPQTGHVTERPIAFQGAEKPIGRPGELSPLDKALGIK